MWWANQQDTLEYQLPYAKVNMQFHRTWYKYMLQNFDISIASSVTLTNPFKMAREQKQKNIEVLHNDEAKCSLKKFKQAIRKKTNCYLLQVQPRQKHLHTEDQ